MASAKQIAWRKKFAKMAKSGKFKKSKKPKLVGMKNWKPTKAHMKSISDRQKPPTKARLRAFYRREALKQLQKKK